MTPQTTSLETSKKLKELGVPQISLWKYPICFRVTSEGRNYKNSFTCSLVLDSEGKNNKMMDQFDSYASYTSDEIGRWLPFNYIHFTKLQGKGYGCSTTKPNSDEVIYMSGETEAEARAKMLIYLIENGYVDVKSLLKEKI